MKDLETGRGPQAFKLKGTAPALTLLCMLTEDLDAVERQLSDHLRQMPQFFLYAPIVVDLSELGNARVDLARLAELLRRHNLVPVAVRNPTDSQQVLAVSAGWAILQSGLSPNRKAPGPRSQSEGKAPSDVRASRPPAPPESAESPLEDPAADAEGSVDLAEPIETQLPGLVVRTPVRSGQVIHAVGGDLVVIAPVSSGAELIADGNIHVYGPLRGRALAGARGNSDVSIFCLGLEAEFISIAGRYLMADEIAKVVRGKPMRAYLDGEALVVTPL
ncbi:MAG TPA: septum site-determining protein MinC [Polyangiaceae bacterium]|nr:septum site-determining protein MinC [Polyangiaceae bacterium]